MKLIENWFSERYSDNLQLSFRVMDQLLSVKTDYQRIDVFETYDFGKLMSIDGTVQLTERDEFVYHEMITMVPSALFHGRPKSALVIGGGDGGTASQLINIGYDHIVNVEIDGQVVEVARKYFQGISSAFSDPRVRILVEDGIRYVKETEEKFDIVIVDSTDPVGPAEGLFNAGFYKSVQKILNKGGVVVTQSGSPFYQPKALTMANSAMREVFPNVSTYTAFIPTYPSGFWSFTVASDSQLKVDDASWLPDGKYFNRDVLKGCFSLPQFVKDLLDGKNHE